MSVTVEKSGATAVRPFHVDIPDEALGDLRRRIVVDWWPSREAVDDRSQGVQLVTIEALARYWATEVEQTHPSLSYFNEVDRGARFAAWEEPELFATDLRAAFRSLLWCWSASLSKCCRRQSPRA